MKIYVINALKFVIFEFFEEYVLNLRCLNSTQMTLINKTQNLTSNFFYIKFINYFYS